MNQVPQLHDPDHAHVKAIMYLYSMETFLYKRINEISRNKDSSVILNLGPYAVALTRIIKNT